MIKPVQLLKFKGAHKDKFPKDVSKLNNLDIFCQPIKDEFVKSEVEDTKKEDL